MNESGSMVGGPVFGSVIMALSIVFFALAALSVGTCGNGYALIYVGLGVLLIAAGVAALGQPLLSVVPFAIFLILLVIGIALSKGASCAILP